AASRVTSARHATGREAARRGKSVGGSDEHDRSTRTAGSYNNEGLILREREENEGARTAFEHAIALDPHHASALFNLSELLRSDGGAADRADDLLLRALSDGIPDGPKALVGRAIAHRRAGRIEKSLALLDRAVLTSPSDPQFWLYRGRFRVERHDCRGAL